MPVFCWHRILLAAVYAKVSSRTIAGAQVDHPTLKTLLLV